MPKQTLFSAALIAALTLATLAPSGPAAAANQSGAPTTAGAMAQPGGPSVDPTPPVQPLPPQTFVNPTRDVLPTGPQDVAGFPGGPVADEESCAPGDVGGCWLLEIKCTETGGGMSTNPDGSETCTWPD